MKNNSTKPTDTQSKYVKTTIEKLQDAYDLQQCTVAASRFFSRFKVVKLLGDVVLIKKKAVFKVRKGFPVTFF